MKSITLTLALMSISVAAGYAQAPAIMPGGVANAAGTPSSAAVVPGSLVSIYGSNLAAALTQATSIPLSTTLGTTSVTFNNIQAPLLFVAGAQINAQVPWEVAGSSAQVVVTNGGVSSAPVTAQLAPAAPAIFAYNGNLAIAYGNSDQAFAWASGAVAGVASHAAKIGDPTTLVILATGLGAVTQPVATGGVPPGASNTTGTPAVTVGGVPAQVVFCGLIDFAVGVYQINIVIQPGTPTGNAVPLQIAMNGITSNSPTIAVSN